MPTQSSYAADAKRREVREKLLSSIEQRDKVIELLEEAISEIEWTRPSIAEQVAEYHDGWPRYETYRRPNKVAKQRADELRQRLNLIVPAVTRKEA